MTKFDITVVSDTVCPWCYVGKKRMEQAIKLWGEKHPGSQDTFSTTWFPFYLQPDSPKQGIDKQQYFVQKFGADRMGMMFQRLDGIGRSVGIHFKFGGKTGNTRNSHRLIQLGKTYGPEKQTRVIEELFTGYFENEQDITSLEVLTKAGIDAGLPANEVKEWLGSDKGGPEVDREVLDAQKQFIHGVPYFTINGKYHLEGAEDSSAFLQIFEAVRAENQIVPKERPAADSC